MLWRRICVVVLARRLDFIFAIDLTDKEVCHKIFQACCWQAAASKEAQAALPLDRLSGHQSKRRTLNPFRNKRTLVFWVKSPMRTSSSFALFVSVSSPVLMIPTIESSTFHLTCLILDTGFLEVMERHMILTPLELCEYHCELCLPKDHPHHPVRPALATDIPRLPFGPSHTTLQQG